MHGLAISRGIFFVDFALKCIEMHRLCKEFCFYEFSFATMEVSLKIRPYGYSELA